MSAPRRLIDDPTADRALQRVLRDGAGARPLDELTRRRLGARLSRAAALPAVAAGWLFVKSAAAALGAVGVAATVATVTGVVDWPSTTPAPAAPSALAPAKPALPMPPAPDLAVPQPVDIPAPAVKLEVAASSSAVSAPSAGVSSLAAESILLEQARREVRRAPAIALHIAGEHAQRFPGGQLASERTLIQVEALHRLGRDDEARARAAGLLRGASGDLYRERVRSLLGESGAL